jgi:hypothetical protein
VLLCKLQPSSPYAYSRSHIVHLHTHTSHTFIHPLCFPLTTQTILVFLSASTNALSLILVSLAQTSQAALGAFAIFALGSGDAPTYKSVFVAAVPDQHASQALAALDMVFNGARLLSPLLLGSLYAWFAERGRPEGLFMVAGVSFC